MRFVACLLLLIVSVASAEPLQLAGTTMGTTYSVRIADWPENQKSAALHKQIEVLLDKIDHTFSTYREDSEISRLYQADVDEWLPISPEMLELLRLSREVQIQSKGTFDITISPLVKLWKDAAKQSREPTQNEIESAKETIGLEQWELRDNPIALRKRNGALRFDVNGIVPGYAVDQLADLLEQASLQNYLIEIGGEVRARGNAWQIGIEAPVASSDGKRQILSQLPINNSAVATSGDYRQGIEIAGKRYSHIIDPRSGWPITQHDSSITVVMDSCAQADAWATALFVHGPAAGITLADERQIAACFVVQDDSGFKLIASQAFNARFSEVSSTKKALDHRMWYQMHDIIAGLGGLIFYWFICFYLPHINFRRRR